MNDFFQINLRGRLGGDPVIRNIANGRMATMRVVVNNYRGKDADGNRREVANGINVVCFRDELISVIEKYLKKGTAITILNGAYEVSTYEVDGAKRERIQVKIDLRSEIMFNNPKSAESPNAPAYATVEDDDPF